MGAGGQMQIFNVSASFTRPADTTAYASGDLVANSTTAGSVVPMSIVMGNHFPQAAFRITRARLYKSGTTATNANFRVHLYQALPATFANGDNGAWSTSNSADWLGNIDVTSMLAFTDGCAGTGSAAAGSEMFIKTAAGSTIYAVLEAKAAYTPASAEVFTLVLEEVDDF